MSWWSSLFPKSGRVMLPVDMRRRWERIVVCEDCGREGHGKNDWECARHVEELEKVGARCFRPKGVILVWDEVEVSLNDIFMEIMMENAHLMARVMSAKYDGQILVWDEVEV